MLNSTSDTSSETSYLPLESSQTPVPELGTSPAPEISSEQPPRTIFDPPTPTDRTVDVAKRYVRLGYPVMPIRWGEKLPKNSDWQNEYSPRDGENVILNRGHTLADDAIEVWFDAPDSRDSELGIPTHGMVVCDFDVKERDWTDESIAEAIGIPVEELQKVPTVITPSGGRHVYFRDETEEGVYKNAAGNIPDSDGRPIKGFDIRARGGYVKAYPSRGTHDPEVGGPPPRYEWMPGRELCPYHDLPEVPAALKARLTRSLPQDAVGENVGASNATIFNRDGISVGRFVVSDTPIPEGQRDNMLYRIGCYFRGCRGLEEDEILLRLTELNENRCLPPLDREQVVRIAEQACKKPQEVKGRFVDQFPTQTPPPPEILTGLQRRAQYPDLKPPVIDKVFREGEVVNIIAAPKVGKSFLAMLLGLVVANQLRFLSWNTVNPFSHTPDKGLALLVDNELDPETLSWRLGRVADDAIFKYPGEDERDYTNRKERMLDRVHSISLVTDNYWDNLSRLADFLRKTCEPGRYRIIVLDALYRMLEDGASENDNVAATTRYKTLKRLAVDLGAAIVLIHHTSKGDQSGKAVTDVGAGAGAQSRAADAHIVLRPHQNEDSVVLHAVSRTWREPAPVVLTKAKGSVVWRVDSEADPQQLLSRDPQAEATAARDSERRAKVVRALTDSEPMTRNKIKEVTGISLEPLIRVLANALDEKIIVSSTEAGSSRILYTLPERADGEATVIGGESADE